MVRPRLCSRVALATLAILSVPSMARAADDTVCDRAPVAPSSEASRHVTATDLIGLRDFGYADAGVEGSPFSLSPDHRSLALELRRADPASNSYCVSIVVLDLRTGQARTVDQGGTPIYLTTTNWGGQAAMPTGVPALITPIWSPDGRTLAYRRRENDRIDIRVIPLDGGRPTNIGQSDADALSVRWAPDGQLLYEAAMSFAAAGRSIAAEGLRGYHYDDRYWPVGNAVPHPLAPLSPTLFATDVRTGMSRAANDAERRLFAGTDAMPPGTRLVARAPERMAWTADQTSGVLFPDVELWTMSGKRPPQRCTVAACATGVVGIWWFGKDLVFLHREGWARSELALYRWRVGSKAPRRLLATADALIGCQSSGDALICAKETSTSPRRIVRIDATTGRSALIFDPNPEFSRIGLGSVERLHWTFDGQEGFGDLVLPPEYKSGTKLPLVIVQYDTHGFLRGGVGDEYPIQLFAERGYAVLSFQRPRDWADRFAAKTFDEFQRRNTEDWADRRNVFDDLKAGIQLLVDRGIVDRTKIGITGLSDGSSTVQYALTNSELFAAAAISSCCEDPKTASVLVGPRFAAHQKAWGYPTPSQDRPAFWADYSIAANAHRLRVPILLQLSDWEYLYGLETYATMRDAHRPIDLYVFPNEYHFKMQPAHRLAVYGRNLAWFDFWLRGIRPSEDWLKTESERWPALDAEQQSSK